MSEPVMKARCYPEILALYEELKEHRRDVHAHPELGFDTDRTVEKIVAFLQRHGITEIDTTTVKGSVIAVLTGNQPGVTVEEHLCRKSSRMWSRRSPNLDAWYCSLPLRTP